MKLRILGCSGGIRKGSGTTSMLVDDDVLIDAGTGLGTLTIEEMSKVRHIFLTHSHLDHIACLPLLVDSIFDRIETPIIIHALPATIKALQSDIFNWAIWPDFSILPNLQAPVMTYQEMEPGEIFHSDGRSFEMIPVNHIVPTVGYRVECETGCFVFSGDTTTNDTLWDAINAYKQLDLLIVEAAFANKDKELCQLARHYCPSLLAEDLQKLTHRPRIAITHNKPGNEEAIRSELTEAVTDRELIFLESGHEFEF